MINGWTALSFWDRSGDSRPGSCSVFVFDSGAPTVELLAHARTEFPAVFARFDFDLKEIPNA